jgi:chemotaxis signal transduction protein
MSKLSQFLIKHNVDSMTDITCYDVAWVVEEISKIKRCSQDSILSEALESDSYAQYVFRVVRNLKEV